MGSKGDERKVTAGFAATKGLETSRAVLNTLKLVGEEEDLAFLKGAAETSRAILTAIRVRTSWFWCDKSGPNEGTLHRRSKMERLMKTLRDSRWTLAVWCTW
jgi:hypothetical protein